MPKPKYTTITELAAAFKSGELDSTYHLVIDKGGCSLSLRQDGPEEGENERCRSPPAAFQTRIRMPP